MKAHSSLFLALPSSLAYSSRESDGKRSLRKLYVEDFKQLIEQLKEYYYDVCCTLDYSHWKADEFPAAAESVRNEWSRMKDCTQVIACPSFGAEVSGGVHIEIGWATSLGLPLTIIAARIPFSHSALIGGLPEQKGFNCESFYYRKRPREVFGRVRNRVLAISTNLEVLK